MHACRYGNVPKRPLPHHSDDVDGGDGDDGDGDGGDDEHDDGVYVRKTWLIACVRAWLGRAVVPKTG